MMGQTNVSLHELIISKAKYARLTLRSTIGCYRSVTHVKHLTLAQNDKCNTIKWKGDFVEIKR